MKIKKIKKYILTGIIALLPISITYWVISKIFIYFAYPGKLLIDALSKSEMTENLDFFEFTRTYDNFSLIEYCLGFLLILLFIIILGILISNIFGKRLFAYFEEILLSIPIVSKVYVTIKQIVGTITKQDDISFQKVAMIEYPRKGIWALCFITGKTSSKDDEYYNIFIPTTPIPTSGYLLFIKVSDVVEVDISVEEAMRIIISGGMVAPNDFKIIDNYDNNK